VDLDRRRLVNYPGNYQRYLEQRAAREANLATAEQKRQGILRRELEWLRRGAMARTTKQKARKQRIEELQQIRYDLGEERLLMALASRRLGKQVLTVRGVSKRYDDLQLFEGVDFELAPGDRVGMIGPNGAGKSTFLDILAGYVAPDAGEVRWGETVRLGYYDQQSRGLVDQMKVIDFINERAPLVRTPDGTRVEAAQMLEWFLFPRPQQQAQIGALSGGERRRLYLLSVLVHQPNVLLLDEPTNDLDVPTLAVLESFLDRFEGVLLVVSHDRYFLDRTVDYLAVFENGRFSPRYPAPYSSYQRLRQAEPETAVADEDAEARETAVVTRPRRPERPRRLTWKEQRELEQLNQRVDALEGEKSGLQQAINASGGDYVRLQQLAGRLQHVEAELDGLLERWIELSEIDAHA
jgi:ABC transport system ATP-binding/permease protein